MKSLRSVGGVGKLWSEKRHAKQTVLGAIAAVKYVEWQGAELPIELSVTTGAQGIGVASA